MKEKRSDLFWKIFLIFFTSIMIILAIESILNICFGIGTIVSRFIKYLFSPKDNVLDSDTIITMTVTSIGYSIALACTRVVHTPADKISKKFFKEDRNKQETLNLFLIILFVILNSIILFTFIYLLGFGIKTN